MLSVKKVSNPFLYLFGVVGSPLCSSLLLGLMDHVITFLSLGESLTSKTLIKCSLYVFSRRRIKYFSQIFLFLWAVNRIKSRQIFHGLPLRKYILIARFSHDSLVLSFAVFIKTSANCA